MVGSGGQWLRWAVLVCVLGLTSSRFAGAAPATPPTDDVSTIGLRPASKADRESMASTLEAALKALRKPGAPYAPAKDGTLDEVATRFGALEGSTRAIPLEAWGERIYEAPDAAGGADDETRTLELRIAVNGTRELSGGLGTAGAAIHPFDLSGALALEQSIIGAEDGSRVALPLDKEEAANALTLLRVYVTDPELEKRLRRIAEAGSAFPAVDPSQLLSNRPDSVRSIIVELYGGKKDVESLARRVDVKALRKLLTD